MVHSHVHQLEFSTHREGGLNEKDKAWVEAQLNRLIERAAMAARGWASSYRGFSVGCAMGVRAKANGSSSYHIGMGANYKTGPGPSPKGCAEATTLHDVAGIPNAEEILVIVVFGPPQEDHESGHDGVTLHPCGSCRTMLSQSKLVTEKTMIVCVSSEDSTTMERMTFTQLLALHNGSGH